jgi:hypothetical protein
MLTYYYDNRIYDIKMSGSYGSHEKGRERERERRSAYNFGRKTLRKETMWKT